MTKVGANSRELLNRRLQNKKEIIIVILYLTTCHLGAESSFKRERETNYNTKLKQLMIKILLSYVICN